MPSSCTPSRRKLPVYNSPFKPAGAEGFASKPTATVPHTPFARWTPYGADRIVDVEFDIQHFDDDNDEETGDDAHNR